MAKLESAKVLNKITVDDVDWNFLDFDGLRETILGAFVDQIHHATTYNVDIALYEGKLHVGIPFGSEGEPLEWQADFLEIIRAETRYLEKESLVGVGNMLRDGLALVEAKLASDPG